MRGPGADSGLLAVGSERRDAVQVGGYSISLLHLRLALLDREFEGSDYELLQLLDQAERGGRLPLGLGSKTR